MKTIDETLYNLIKYIDQSLDSLLAKVKDQEGEIKQLQIYNQQLKKQSEITLTQVEQYVTELEQIKKYVNSNYKIK